MVKFLAALLLIPALALGGAARLVRADQTDPRLDALFATLDGSPNVERASRIERRIWAIWMTSDDPVNQKLMRQGNAAMAARLYPVARQLFTRLIKRAPAFAEAWNRRATLYYLTGDYVASIKDIERVLVLEPRHFGALSGLGMIMIELDRPKAALESFEKALEVHPHMPGPRTQVERLRRQLEGDPT